MVKKNKQERIAENLSEECVAILEKCIKCGMCKSLCPVFKVLKEEEISPRGHSISLNDKKITEAVFQCTLCKACEQKCPLNLKICDAIKIARESLNSSNKELKSNKEMVRNIRKTGNPFGKGKIDPDKLYCC